MTAGDWIALAGLFLSVIACLAGIAYRVGRISQGQHEVLRRLERVEQKLDRLGL